MKDLKINQFTNQDSQQSQLNVKAFLKLHILHFNVILFFVSFYLLFSSLLGNKQSIIILVLSNLLHNLFTKKSDTLMKFMEGVHKYFRRFEIIEEEKISDQGCMLPMHPHNIYALGSVIGVTVPGSPLKKGVLLGTSMATDIAIHGILIKSYGIQGVNASNFKRLMRSNTNVIFVPGGFEEATITSHKEYRIYLRNRKGFIKYALQFGYKVHPTFVFNENKCWKTLDYFIGLRMLVNKLKLPGCIFYNKYVMYPDPNVDIYVVIGKGIQFPKIESPTQQLIDQYHNLYKQELINLYNRNVEKYDPGAKLFIDEFINLKAKL